MTRFVTFKDNFDPARQCGLCELPQSPEFVDEEVVREGRKAIQARFLNWRDPPIELPADSVIDEAVRDVIKLLYNSEVKPDE